MPIVNADIAAIFDEIADLLEVEGANAFRIRAYRNAARTLSELGRSVETMVDRGENLDALPGIGPDLAAKIAEISHTGTCELLDRLRHELPPAVTELLKIRGLGPKRVRALHQELGVHTLAELHGAAAQGRVRAVHGFGPQLEAQILEATASRLTQNHRFKLPVALEAAHALLTELAAVPGVQQAVVAGSLRRMRETVGDLDLLVTAQRAGPATECLATAHDVDKVLVQGPTRASVVLRNGMQVDMRAVPPESYGPALLYFTGSKAHNIALRRLAQEAGFKLNEYGLYKGARRVAGATEAEVYRALGLPYIEPELREDRGELEAARTGRLPALVDQRHLRGDLHVHTSHGEGLDPVAEMATAARARGLAYIAVADLAQHVAAPRGLDADALARQIDHIDALNEKLRGITVLKSAEVDILKDGRLGMPDALLARLDFVIAAVHHGFDLSRTRQTGRVLRAMDHPSFTVLAHPSCRVIGERAPCEIDMQRIVRKARERGCFLELDAHPARLDLTDTGCRMAKEEGVLVSMGSGARSTRELDHLPYGIAQARRGWLEARDVLNTRPLGELRALLNAAMGRPSPAPRHPAATA